MKLMHLIALCFFPCADRSLARLWKETSYSDQDLHHYTTTYGIHTTGIYSCKFNFILQFRHVEYVLAVAVKGISLSSLKRFNTLFFFIYC